jgi:hypothetical protein
LGERGAIPYGIVTLHTAKGILSYSKNNNEPIDWQNGYGKWELTRMK